MLLHLAPAALKARKPMARRSVLIADRDEVALDEMRRYLLLRGYEVETATGGVECLNKLRRCEEPILVLESELPWGGADGVLAVLREEPQLANTPVILTSSAVGSVGDRFDRAPVLRLLTKPFSLDDLLRCLHTAEARSEVGGQA